MAELIEIMVSSIFQTVIGDPVVMGFFALLLMIFITVKFKVGLEASFIAVSLWALLLVRAGLLPQEMMLLVSFGIVIPILLMFVRVFRR